MQERFEEFTLLISNIHRCIYKIKTEEVAEYNLKSSHVSCLYYIYKAESLTAKELCDMCGEDKANVSRAIKSLEENGFLLCNSKTAKRYKSPLLLTEKGMLAAQGIVEKVDGVLAYTSEGVSDEERRIMYQSLNRIYDNLHKLCNAYSAEETEK